MKYKFVEVIFKHNKQYPFRVSSLLYWMIYINNKKGIFQIRLTND